MEKYGCGGDRVLKSLCPFLDSKLFRYLIFVQKTASVCYDEQTLAGVRGVKQRQLCLFSVSVG